MITYNFLIFGPVKFDLKIPPMITNSIKYNNLCNKKREFSTTLSRIVD